MGNKASTSYSARATLALSSSSDDFEHITAPVTPPGEVSISIQPTRMVIPREQQDHRAAEDQPPLSLSLGSTVDAWERDLFSPTLVVVAGPAAGNATLEAKHIPANGDIFDDSQSNSPVLSPFPFYSSSTLECRDTDTDTDSVYPTPTSVLLLREEVTRTASEQKVQEISQVDPVATRSLIALDRTRQSRASATILTVDPIPKPNRRVLVIFRESDSCANFAAAAGDVGNIGDAHCAPYGGYTQASATVSVAVDDLAQLSRYFRDLLRVGAGSETLVVETSKPCGPLEAAQFFQTIVAHQAETASAAASAAAFVQANGAAALDASAGVEATNEQQRDCASYRSSSALDSSSRTHKLTTPAPTPAPEPASVPVPVLVLPWNKQWAQLSRDWQLHDISDLYAAWIDTMLIGLLNRQPVPAALAAPLGPTWATKMPPGPTTARISRMPYASWAGQPNLNGYYRITQSSSWGRPVYQHGLYKDQWLHYCALGRVEGWWVSLGTIVGATVKRYIVSPEWLEYPVALTQEQVADFWDAVATFPDHPRLSNRTKNCAGSFAATGGVESHSTDERNSINTCCCRETLLQLLAAYRELRNSQQMQLWLSQEEMHTLLGLIS